MSLSSLIALISLVLIGGLCLYCFTKAFGITFLGTRRSHQARVVEEVPLVMIVPLMLLVMIIIFIGFFPAYVTSLLSSVVENFHNFNMDTAQLQETFIALERISLVNAVLLMVALVLAGIRYWQQLRIRTRVAATWGCGYSGGDFRHQYTPTSYADSVRQLADPFISFHRHYKPITGAEIFPGRRSFHTESYDKIEQSGIIKLIQILIKYLPQAGFAQTGMIRHYLIYPLAFILLVGILTFLNYL